MYGRDLFSKLPTDFIPTPRGLSLGLLGKALEYLKDDGTLIEPRWYAPIIPLILVNGSKGIGTGFSTDITCFNVKQIITYIENILLDQEFLNDSIKFIPHFNNFKGMIKHHQKIGSLDPEQLTEFIKSGVKAPRNIGELIGNKIKKIGKRKSFLIHGTGNEIRSFIHIDDFISGFDKIFRKGKNTEIYNIGNSEKVKISYLVNLIAKIYKKKIKIIKSKLLKGSPSKRCPDIKKIKKLGFNQEISLRHGIKKIILND